MNAKTAMVDVITYATIQLAPLSVTALMATFWIQMAFAVLVSEISNYI